MSDDWIGDVIQDICELDGGYPDGTPDVLVVSLKDLKFILLNRGPASSSDDFPSCSGDDRDCPENEGHGCCFRPGTVHPAALPSEQERSGLQFHGAPVTLEQAQGLLNQLMLLDTREDDDDDY